MFNTVKRTVAKTAQTLTKPAAKTYTTHITGRTFSSSRPKTPSNIGDSFKANKSHPLDFSPKQLAEKVQEIKKTPPAEWLKRASVKAYDHPETDGALSREKQLIRALRLPKN